MQRFILERSSYAGFIATYCGQGEIDQFALTRGDCKTPKQLKFEWAMGSRQADEVIWTDGVGMLVGSRFRKALTGFTGWTSVPVALTGREREVLRGYHFFIVTGRCGAWIPALTKRIRRGRVSGLDLYRGLHFVTDEKTEDVYVTHDRSVTIMMNENAARALADLQSSPLKLVSCEDSLVPQSLREVFLSRGVQQ